MSELFNRYYLVLSGRVSEEDCGALVTAEDESSASISLTWQTESAPINEHCGTVGELTKTGRAISQVRIPGV
jgi:hypothetical protein